MKFDIIIIIVNITFIMHYKLFTNLVFKIVIFL